MAVGIIERVLDIWGDGHETSGWLQGNAHNGEQRRDFDASRPDRTEPATKALRRIELDLDTFRALGIMHPQITHTALAEEYRRIKQPLMQGMGNEVLQQATRLNLIMVTSAIAGEGKTFTALNLAMSIAMEKDRTVLLVDADMTNRGLSRLLRLDTERGLSDLLQDERTQLGDVLVQTDIDNVTVLPIGRYNPQYTELVGSTAMRKLSQRLANRSPQRAVVFDAPPLIGASAACALANLMHQIIMVVEVGKTPRNTIQEAMVLLGASKPVGVVLNKYGKVGPTKYYASEKA